jgi:hypothetical protein
MTLPHPLGAIKYLKYVEFFGVGRFGPPEESACNPSRYRSLWGVVQATKKLKKNAPNRPYPNGHDLA